MNATAVRAVRAGFALPVAVAAVAGVAGGLMRAGALPAATWSAPAALGHAQLMCCGVLGTLVSLERAVALRRRRGWVAPALSAAAAAAVLAGAPAWAALGNLAAALAFVATTLALHARQPAPHATLAVAAACAWAGGAAIQVAGGPADAAIAAWLAFLVGTIAAERLEMTRLTRRRPGTGATLAAAVSLLGVGVAASAVSPRVGGLAYGSGLVAIAAWLLVHDVARRTVSVPGLPRYMAVCLLAGYAWLGVSGLAWSVHALTGAGRDTAVHALALGFVASMVFAHAPVILPALARIKLQHGWPFYLPLALLHATLALRVAPGPGGSVHGAATLGNAVALLAFAATVAGAAAVRRRRHPPPRTAAATAATAGAAR